jgi:hypothetical protein
MAMLEEQLGLKLRQQSFFVYFANREATSWFRKIDLRASLPPWVVIAGLLRFDVDPALQLFALPAA